jgi:hypothetical protein
MADMLKYDFHPVFRTAMAIGQNRTHTGAPIWNENDDMIEIGARQLWFAANDLIKMTENSQSLMERAGFDPGRFGPEMKSKSDVSVKDARAQSALLKWMTGHAFSIANVYARTPRQQRIMREIDAMGRQLKKDQQEYVRQHGYLNRQWLQNYMERMQRKLEELRE